MNEDAHHYCQRDAVIAELKTRQEEMYKRIDRNAEWLKEVETMLSAKMDCVLKELRGLQRPYQNGRGRWLFWASIVTSITAVTVALIERMS
jgi:hypothetical protein